MKILLGLPSGSGVVPIPMVQSLLQLHKPYPVGFVTVERQRIDKSRNYMCMQTLAGGFDYLFMVDDDNPIPPDTLEKLIEADKDIVGVPILSRNPNKDGKHTMCAYYAKEIKTKKGKVKIYENIEKFKDEGHLHKVDAVGTGALLIKRKVLEKLNKKYQDYIFEFGDIRFPEVEHDGKTYDRRTMSEDCEFCERAINEGFEVWLDDRIRPYHLTSSGGVQWQPGM